MKVRPNLNIEDTDVRADGLHPCGRCGGTGQYVTMVVNGKPHGPGGVCFRCGGKGEHDAADRKRNWGYSRYGIRVYLGGGGYDAEAGPHQCHGTISRTCGVRVCTECRRHQGLARCFCGWAADGGDGAAQLVAMGETL